MKKVGEVPSSKSPPYITNITYNLLKRYLGLSEAHDFYPKERKYFNKKLLNLTKKLEDQQNSTIDLYLKAAIKAWLDIGIVVSV